MFRHHLFYCFGLRFAVLCYLACQVATLAAQEKVRIAMRPDAMIGSANVKLGDLAIIEGGSSEKRAAISQLDLRINSTQNKSVISRGEMTTRLLMAGFDPNDFQLHGARTKLIRGPAENGIQASLQNAISRHVSGTLNMDLRDVQVTVLSFPEALAEYGDGQYQFSALDHADRIIGRRTVMVGVFRHGRMEQQVQVLAQTSINKEVLVALRPIERGEVLDRDNAFLERRQFGNFSNKWIAEDGFGQTASRRIRAQEAIRSVDLARKNQTNRKEVIVRARDIVTVVATKGALKITMSGMEAMKSGGVGDVIPLRNPDSKKIVYGKIINASRIELSF